MNRNDWGCVLGSNGPISNVITIPQLTQKDDNLKQTIFGHFYLFTNSCIKMCKVNSKDFSHKWEKVKKKFSRLPIFFNSDPILMTTIRKSIYFNRAKTL